MSDTRVAAFERIAQAAPVALTTYRLTVDGRGSFPYASAAFATIYGIDPETVRDDATAITALTDPRDLARVARAIEHSARTLQPLDITFRICHPHRGEVWLEVRSQPARDTDGAIVWAGTVTDVTAARRDSAQRDELEEAAAMRDGLLDISFDAILIWEFDGALVYWNRGATQLYGFAASDAVGAVSHALLQTRFPDSLAAVRASLRDAGGWSGTLEHRHRDGRRIVVDSRMQLVTARDGRPLVFESNRDITARVDAEQLLRQRSSELERLNAQLERINDDLNRANAELEQFSYVASHDLQEPLRGVVGCVQLLERRCADQVDARGQEYIRLTVDAALRMQALLDDLLAFSRIHRPSSERHLVDLDAAVDRACRNLATSIGEAQAEITREPLGQAFGDPVMITSVFQNLIGNALKFRRDPVRIHLSARDRSDGRLIGVHDNGIGIEPNTSTASLASFSDCTRARNIPAPAWGWPSAAASSSASAAASGRSRRPVTGPPSGSSGRHAPPRRPRHERTHGFDAD